MLVPNEFAVVVDEWFDGEARRPGRATLRVHEGRIAGITGGDHGAALEAKGIPVERGVFLMPGLVDAHVHLFLDGAPTDSKIRSQHMKQPVEKLLEAGRASARQTLACGITAVRDGGDKWGVNNRVRDEAARPDRGLPQICSAGAGVKRPKRYGSFMAVDVTDADSIRSTVCDLGAVNDEIKLVLTGIIDFEAGAVTDEPQFDLEEAKLVVQAACTCGCKVMTHCSGLKGLEIAARAGVGSIEHGFFMTREILALMVENNVAWTPTFCPVHFQWAHPEAVGWSPETIGHLRRILDDHARHLLIAQELGVTLLLGTDAGSMGVEHGHAVYEEINRYLEAGLSLEATLKAATSANRRYLDIDDPVLTKGASFDAVLLTRSPFDDVRALRAPAKVWRNGQTCR